MTEPRPDLSIVIVTYNAEHLIGHCLDAVRRQSAGLSIEVLVVDNGSSDGTVALLRSAYPWVDLQDTGRNLGFSIGSNLGLRRCRGRFVMLLNPDTLPQPRALSGLLAHLQAHPQVGAVGPMLRLGDGAVQPECARYLPTPANLLPWLLLLDKLALRLAGRRLRAGLPSTPVAQPPPPRWFDGFNLLQWRRDTSCAVQSLCGACLLIRREALDQVGWLDESSPMYLDDIDYCRRLIDHGWQLHYVSTCEVTHLWQQSTRPGQGGRQFALVCHSLWLYLRKHHGTAAGRGFVLMTLLAVAVRLPAALLMAPWPGPQRDNRLRRLHIALGMGRWACRFPKRPPRLGFAGERLASSQLAPGARRS